MRYDPCTRGVPVSVLIVFLRCYSIHVVCDILFVDMVMKHGIL